MSESKNDIEWEKIFEKHRLLDIVLKDGNVEITAKQINEFREARLMTKFDHKSQLPKIFAKNKLSILPTSRGGYIIGSFETFHNFNIDEPDIIPCQFPVYLESIDYKDITSESTAINCAFVSRILQDFTEEENLLPTVSGRMGSSSFNFDIKSSKGLLNIDVRNSQVEIDGGFEGDRSLTLIEAKNYISDDFLIRQLYYPFKLWSNKIQKQVRPVFLTYTNGIFHLREYKFFNEKYYNSLVLVKHRKYFIQEEGSFNLEVLLQILENTKTVKEPEIPFPQADKFERVINLCELLKQKEFISKEEITQNYDFVGRQTDYYSNAGKYLGLIDTRRDSLTGQIGCFLTNKGKQVFSLNLHDRQKEFIKLIVSHSAFKQALSFHLTHGQAPDKNTVVEIMLQSKIHNVESDSTFNRRASTIVGWTNWIIDQVEE